MKHVRHCASIAAGPCTCRATTTYPRGERNQPPLVDWTSKRQTASRRTK